MKNRWLWLSSRGPAVGRIFVPSSTSFHAVPKVPGKLQAGCSHCATEEGWRGVMHSVPHTAGLTMKPHYCKLPQFTLSKGAKMDKTTTKKDSFKFWETSSHGLIKLSTCTYHKLYPLCVLMKCYTVLWSVVLLSVHFFPAVGPSRRLSLSNCPWHWLWLLRAQKREVEERERRIITQGTFPQETDINPSPPLSSLLHLSPLLPLHWLSPFFITLSKGAIHSVIAV